jgi:predicted metallo-beta-lactamase superfamily hydrolase
MLSQETELELERVFRNLTFFEARTPERIVVDGKLTKDKSAARKIRKINKAKAKSSQSDSQN